LQALPALSNLNLKASLSCFFHREHAAFARAIVKPARIVERGAVITH
jgi:hypothetical protein